MRLGGLPGQRWLGDFAFAPNPNINPATIHQLASGDWIRKDQLMCLIGNSGIGKSRLLIRLGTAAGELGFRAKHTLATRLGAELRFQVLTEREEKSSVAIASNESFSGWTKTFPDPRLCAAIVHLLAFDGNIIETDTDSHRGAHTKMPSHGTRSIALISDTAR